MQANINQKNIAYFSLYKQHLARGLKAESKLLVEVVRDICGLHAQVATTPYLSLWNRLADFHKEDLSRELYEKRTLVKIWGVRATLHILPVIQVAEYYQTTKGLKGRLTLSQLEPVHKRILKVLDEVGALTAQELTSYIPELDKIVQTRYGDMSLGQWSLRQMSQSTILVPVKPRGNWNSNLHTYTSFQKWLPSVDFQALSERDAKERVICYYLSGFGPAMVEDIAWWIGITKGEVKQILEESNKIEHIQIHGLEGAFVVLKSDLEHLQACSAGDDIAHLLPKFDPYIMGYKNRQRLISAEYEKKVYWSTRGEVSPTILLNGQIVGTWSHKAGKGKLNITLSLFEKMDNSLLDIVREEAERLSYFLNGKDHEILVLK